VRTRGIRSGDLVKVDKRGRVFYARVLGASRLGGLALEPLDRRISWRQATAREVVDHWTHARADHAERPADDQLALEDAGER
jgi:hypothetical protein